MSTEIKVPELGESVVEATVGRWRKQAGDHVAVGEVLVELETDKVNMEIGAEREGVLARIDREAGSDVKVGEVIGLIAESVAEAGSPIPAPAPAATPEPTAAPVAAQPAPTPIAATPVTATAPISPEPAATPLARRVAEVSAVDLSQVTASSPGGKVTRGDVERYLSAPPAQPVTAPASTPVPTAKPAALAPIAPQSVQPQSIAINPQEERVPLSRRRRTIAKRLVEAQHTAAMLTTFNEVDMGAVMELREHRKEAFKAKYGVGLGLNSFFVKASISALKQFPRLNAEIDGDDMILKHHYDIGIAVGAEDGLVVPILREADRMSFAAIEKAIKTYAAQVADNSIGLDALRGGTFTITNGGVFGSMLSTPILNAPQVAILGLHKVEPRPVAINNQVVIRPMMYMALSYDHRIVDGREAVQFLVRIKELIEDPNTLLLEG